MKLIEYIKEKEKLASINNLEIEAIKKLLIELKYKTYTSLVLSLNDLLSNDDVIYFDSYINKYINDFIPIQYILNYQYFRNHKFYVDKRVLIPREETSLLVSNAISIINEFNYHNIIDVGCGSGAIGLSIYFELYNQINDLSLTLVDISKDCIDVSKKNYELIKDSLSNQLIERNQKINFIESDLFLNIENNTKFDMIVSNPPYIDISDTDDIDKIVYLNEPHNALFAKDFGLYYYYEIIKKSFEYLKPMGTIVFEIGYNQYNKINDYINNDYSGFFNVSLVKDYNNLDRILILTKLK